MVVDSSHAGDELVLAQFYARWSPLVYSIALGELGSAAEAEEVTLRVFTGVWSSRDTVEANQARLSAWLVGLTRNTLAEAQRVRSTNDTLESVNLTERLVLVDEVSRLDAIPRQVLRMALHEDLTHAEIAERLGLPASSVKSHIRQSLLSLRARLEVQADAC